MIKHIKVFAILFLGLIGTAFAVPHMEISGGTFKAVPVAIPELQGSDPKSAEIARKMTEVIINDLEGCGLFSLVNPQAYIQNSHDVMNKPRLNDWKLINAEALLGGIVRSESGQIVIDFRVFDVFSEQQLAGLRKVALSSHWRKLAHQVADVLYEKITGDQGYFDTRVVYVAQSGSLANRKSRLAIMDQDGEHHQYLTGGASLVLLPRFSPDGTKIAYVDFGKNNKKPNIYIYDLRTGQSQSVGAFQGQKISCRFSPNGDKLIMGIADGGVTSLYEMDLAFKQLRRMTTSSGSIDEAPCYSPDGSQIVFISDRGGRAKIYLMSAYGGAAKCITNGEGSYDNPVWSPRGDLIAFTRKSKGRFYIGVIRADGTGERMLATDYLVEAPTWSPNGRVIMYTRESRQGTSSLYSIDVTGHNNRKAPIPGEGAYSAWSNPLTPQQ